LIERTICFGPFVSLSLVIPAVAGMTARTDAFWLLDVDRRRSENPMLSKPFLTCLFALSVVLMPTPSDAATTVNMCRDAAGGVTYTDSPCAASEVTESSRTLMAPPPPAANPPARHSPSPTGNQANLYHPPAPVEVYVRPDPVVVPPLPQPPKMDLSRLPKDAAGNILLMQSGGASLVLAPAPKPGPINFLARCSGLVSYCYKPGERSLDACFMSAPRCASSRPWDDVAEVNAQCCPSECWQRYEKERIDGQAPLSAFDHALFGANSCMPVTS
jgi:hypothetical protein